MGLLPTNMDLATLLAYQLAQNWNGQINLCMAVADGNMADSARSFFKELISLTRMPGKTKIIVLQNGFEDALLQAPRADQTVFGLLLEPDLAFAQKITGLVDASCVFVRDSGDKTLALKNKRQDYKMRVSKAYLNI